LRAAFGPVIDRLAANNIDLTRMPVEVAPIAHYHMGGAQADARMETEVPGLLVAGEAVGGANGANRLSGNAITEALVFGRRAGRSAAERVARMRARPPSADGTRDALALLGSGPSSRTINTAEMVARLQSTMADDVGPLRTHDGLARALNTIGELEQALGDRPAGDGKPFDLVRVDWLDLRNMLLVARVVTQAALARTESRGAHQREDFSETSDKWQVNQVARWRAGRVDYSAPKVATVAAAQ
jgi:succinate dehydrogenase/fumarate reductase flavoprotein subunit